MKEICLTAAWLASVCCLSGQELLSLDAWVKAQGLTPTIDGGTAGVHYLGSTSPEKAFNGVTYSTSNSERWLGCIDNGTYLRYGIPDGVTVPFEISSYRIYALTAGANNTDRAPRSWQIYGHTDASAAAGDDGWVLIDERSGVAWPFESGGTTNEKDFILEFTLPEPVLYRAYKFVPLTVINDVSARWPWDVGLMEFVFLGNEVANKILVNGAPAALGEVSPAYGEWIMDTGEEITLSAQEYAYADNIRYRCAGYVLEKLDADGAWVLEGTNLYATSFAYGGGGGTQRLTWLWEEDGYKLTTGLEYGGGESVAASPEAEADGYYAAGTEVTLTPVIPEDSSNTFQNWYGDVPEGSETRNPLILTMDAPKTVYANFNRNWRLVEGTANQITDGNWILRVHPLNNGTYSLGTDTTRAIVSGSGRLDLTGIVDDTRLTISTIASNAFYRNSTMLSIALPDTVKIIRGRAFRESSALQSVRLSSNLETVEGYAFSFATALETVTPFLPGTVTSIGSNAFANSPLLTGDLALSNPHLTAIPDGAFFKTDLLSVDLTGSSITSIGTNAFTNAKNLAGVTLSPMLQTIGNYAFQSCSALKTVTPFLPDTVTSLGNAVFNACTALTGDLKLSNPSVASLGNSAFAMTSITSADMGESSITSIGSGVFYQCKSMTNVVLSSVLQSIGATAFSLCVTMETVTPFLPETVQTIGKNAFTTCNNLTGDLKLSNPNLTAIDVGTFYNCFNITSADLTGSGVSSISASAFLGARSLTNLVLTSSIQSIGDKAFYNCSALKCPLELTNPEFTSLGTDCFRGAPLTQITLPDATFSIDDGAFYGAPAGTPVYFLGKAPTSIGTAAFQSASADKPFVMHVCRRMDTEGWAACTTALEDSDRAKDSFPGRSAFGVFVDGEHRNWLTHWNSPLSHNPSMIQIR